MGLYSYLTSLASYYLSSSSHQDLSDYMDDIDNDDTKKDNVVSFDNCNFNTKYYKLFIYIDDSVCDKVKQAYISNAIKHNLLVNSYLTVLNNRSDDVNMEDFCLDSGFDLICPENIISYGSQSVKIDYKINCCMKLCDSNKPDKFVGYYLYCRSSTPLKTPLRLANSVGVIDSGYRGNIKAMFDNIKGYDFMEFELECGNRYTQLCPPNLEYPMKVFIVDSIDKLGKSTFRGSGGFGSTGD